MANYEHTIVLTNNINLHVVQAGPTDGPLVILLHGFPEFWQGWSKQIPALVAAGYRLWVPDQRGYNLSDKPRHIAAYNVDTLADDIIGLIDAAGEEKVYLVGHDWGAAISWHIASKFPDRLHKLIVLNVPHLDVMRSYTSQHLSQMRKSWYFLFFQIPWLPERILQANNYWRMIKSVVDSSHPNTFSSDELEAYKHAWQQPGAVTGMLNWYRAIIQKPPKVLPATTITIPTLIIWGQQDTFLSYEMADLSVKMCENGRLATIPNATHWVQHEAADQVNKLMLDFLAKSENGG